MNSQDRATVQGLLKDMIVAEEEVVKAERLRRILHLKSGQDCISCHVGGLHLQLTSLDRSYMPAAVPGRQALLALLQKEAHDHLIACRSRVEGIQFQIRRLTRG